MKVLILLKSFNYPPKNGGDQAVISAITALSSYVEYSLISLDGSDDGLKTIEYFRKDFENIPACIYPLEKKNVYQKIYDWSIRFSNFFNNRLGNKQSVDMRLLVGYDAQLDYLDAFYRYINKYIADNRIDIVQSEFSFTLGYLKGIVGNVKKVFVQHEIQFVVNYQRLMLQKHTEKDIYFYEQQRQQEINGMNSCDAVITLSRDDKMKLIENGVHTPIFDSFAHVKLHNVDVKYPIKIRKRLVFIGPESHSPNKHGMQWFLQNVWGHILKSEPAIELAVIGRWSEDTMCKWKDTYRNLVFLGYVDDLVASIKESILIVPIFLGSGIRMKILEACNIGIPFVSTSVGAEGLGFTDGIDAYIEDDAVKFAEKVLLLLNDSKLANDFVERSNSHIREKYSNERFIQTRMNCYKSLL